MDNHPHSPRLFCSSYSARFVGFLLLLMAGPSTLWADTPKPIDTAQKYSIPSSRSMITLSPNGEMIGFRARNDERDLVIVYSLKEGKMVTGADVSSSKPSGLYFVNNDHLIVRVVEEDRRLMGFEGRLDLSTAFSLNAKTGELQQLLTPGDGIFKGQSGLGRIVGLSADHSHAYMPAYVGERHDRSPDYSLMRVDLDSPRRPRVHSKGHRDAINFFVNKKGDVLAQERYDDETRTHSIWVPEGRSWRAIYSDDSTFRRAWFSGLTPDMKSLVMLRENRDTGLTSYHTLALDDGKIQALSVGRDDADIESVHTDLSGVVQGVAYSGFHPRYFFFDEAMNQWVKALQDDFPQHSVSVVDWSEDGQRAILLVSGNTTAGDYYLAQRDKPLNHLFSSKPHIPDESVHPVVAIDYQARDELTIPALLTIPRPYAEAPSNMPTVIMPHGGPHSYDRQSFNAWAQAMAEHGYAVLQPQFRGSTGFGKAHWAAGLGEWGRGMQDDLSDAVAFLSDAGISDPERVCIVGASYGGYAALAGAAFTPKIYRCSASINGVSDLTSMMEYEADEHGSDHWVIDHFSRSMARDYFTPERIAAYSPANFANEMQIPVLLIHGEDDKVVPIQQAELMRDNLKEAGKSVAFEEIDDTGHNLGTPEAEAQMLESLLAFLDEHLAAPTELAQQEE